MRKLVQNKTFKEQVKVNQENNRNQLMRRLKDDVELMRKTKQVFCYILKRVLKSLCKGY